MLFLTLLLISYAFSASCLECFEKMENTLKNCKIFSEKVNCDLNATAKECKETEVALIKHCSHKECAGNYIADDVSIGCR